MSAIEYRDRPCPHCPWRTDVDLTRFTDRDMAKLAAADAVPEHPAGLGAPAMACHLDQPGTAHPMRLWLAAAGPHHWAIRMKIAAGRLPPEALDLAADWPVLHENLAALVSVRIRALRQLAAARGWMPVRGAAAVTASLAEDS